MKSRDETRGRKRLKPLLAFSGTPKWRTLWLRKSIYYLPLIPPTLQYMAKRQTDRGKVKGRHRSTFVWIAPVHVTRGASHDGGLRETRGRIYMYFFVLLLIRFSKINKTTDDGEKRFLLFQTQLQAFCFFYLLNYMCILFRDIFSIYNFEKKKCWSDRNALF